MQKLSEDLYKVSLSGQVLSGEDKEKNKHCTKMSASLRKLGKFLEPALTFLNCHFADYYLKSYWDNYLPPKIRLDLEKKSLEEVKSCLSDLANGTWQNYAKSESGEILDFRNVSTLEELVTSIGTLKLSGSLCTSYQTLKENRKTLKELFPKLLVDLEFDRFMTSKKMHEVLQFSEFIACTCNGVILPEINENTLEAPKEKSIRHVVDVGSGKGYLSSFLTLYYDLKVLAIDASATNTDGCQKRSAKLDKTWPKLVRRAKERRDTGSATSFGRNWKKKLTKMGISWEEYQASMEKDLLRCEGNLKSVTEMITIKTDLQGLVSSHFPNEKEKEGRNETNEVDNRQSNSGQNFGIVGLHTCGNLGANILKLFLHNEKAQFICVVPCCYNLVMEDESLYPEDVFYGSKFGLGGEDGRQSAPWSDGSIGFPLSNVLKKIENEKTYVVGRNARMLSAYSLPKLIQTEEGLSMPPVLYYRALLQVFLKRHGLLPDNHQDEDDFRVGRMTKKCSNFRDYVTFALEKLGIRNAEILHDGSLEDIETTYASPKMLDKFHKYYLLRVLFASVVEDLLLLDRLVYLLEQDSIEDAHIVQLFDPAISPRSHAIVAIKKM